MQTLQQDTSAVKEVLNTRVNDTECGLQKLHINQQRLTAELRETKATIMNEMMSELDTRFVTKGQRETKMSKTEATHKLRPGVPEFVPSLSPLTGASGGVTNPGGGPAAAQQFQKPFPFDGRSPWDAYKLQFEMLAAVNCWSNGEKATYLAVSLRGPALTVLTNIPTYQCGDYDPCRSPGQEVWQRSPS